MRTIRKVDAIVFDWLREGVEERLAELLGALEQLSRGENVTEHVFDATQALQTIDRVLSMVDIQLVRVLLRTQLAALAPLEAHADVADEAHRNAISAQIESAVLLQALLDRLATGAEISPASLLPMVNRLRSTLGQSPLDERHLAVRALLVQAEHAVGKSSRGDGNLDEAELRSRLRRMERDALAVMQDDWSVLPDLRDILKEIAARESSRSTLVAIRVVDELLRRTESAPERYASVLKRSVGRVLQLFRLRLRGSGESIVGHTGLDLGGTVLLSLLDRSEDEERICRDSAARWRARLAAATERPARFLGLDVRTLQAARRALGEELLAIQDLLDLFVRGKRDDLEPLGRILGRLGQTSGVLRTLGYPAAAAALEAGRERLQAVTRGAELLDDDMLMDLAGTVMLVEQVIEGLPRRMVQGDPAATLRDQTVVNSIDSIASAAFESLSEAREKIHAGLAGQGEASAEVDDSFAQAADKLNGIAEVLRLSGRDAAIPLVRALARWSRAQVDAGPVEDERALSALGEIFAAVEFYLENLRDFGKEIVRFLEAPKRRIDDLLAGIDPSARTGLGDEARSASPAVSGGQAPAGPADDVPATPDELIEFWQVEEDELAAEASRAAGGDTVESIEAEKADASSGEARESALDFALDEGGKEPPEELPGADDLPDLPDPVDQSSSAGDAPADLESLILPEDRGTASATDGAGASVPDAGARADVDEPQAPILPEEAGTEVEPPDGAPLEPGQGSIAAEEADERPDEDEAHAGPSAEAEALAIADVDEAGAARLESALDLGPAGDRDESRDEGTSTDRSDQAVASPEETGLSRAGAHDTIPDTDTDTLEAGGGSGEERHAADQPATVRFHEEETEAASQLEAAPDFGADDHPGDGSAGADADAGEVAAERPDQPVETPESPGDEAATDSSGEPAGASAGAGASPDDDPTMAEMREVFAEEMAETVPDMAEAARTWLATRDADALVTLRRGFHTIKGSGRMVGLDRIGAWAWGWENLLNQVIDGRRPDNEATRRGAADAVALMQAVLPDLEAGRATPQAYWTDSLHLAERLEAGEPVETTAPAAGGTDEPAVDSRDASGASESTDFAVEGDIDEAASEPEAVEAASETPAPVIEDPVLREIFDQEIGGYVDQLRRAIEAAREQGVGLPCDSDLVRLLHTALGSARTAGVDSIAGLARYLEDWIRALAEHHEHLDGGDLALFAEGVDAIDALRRWAVDPSLDRPDTTDLDQRLDARLRQILAGYGEVGESAEARDDRQAEATESTPDADRPPAEDDLAATAPFEAVVEARDDAGGASGDAPERSAADRDVDADQADAAVDDAEPGDEEAAAEAEPDEEGEDYADIEYRPDDDPAEQDEDILQIFLEEADELLEQADAYLAHWRAHPQDLESIRLLHRNLHTLKGGARMAGLLNLGDVAHHLEGRLDLARQEASADNAPLVALVQHAYDTIAGLLDRVRNRQPIPQQRELIGWIRDPDGARRFAERLRGDEPAGPAPSSDSPGPTTVAAEATEPSSAPAATASADTGPVHEGGAERRDEQVRVAAGSIDALVNQIGESVLLQSRIDRQVNGFERQLFELRQTVTRLRGQLRRLEIETETQIKADLMEEAGVSEEQFDPLEFDRFTQVQELSRGIMESLGDVANIEESLSSLTEQSQLLLVQQSRLGRKMQDGVLAMRLVRFSDVAGRLRRIVRQVSDEMGRQAELVIENGDTEVDRVILMALLPSLEHMLRNSIAHGIEPPEERRARNKAPVGQLLLNVDSGGGTITVSLRDDGRGLDLDAIRRKAVERGLVPADIDLGDEEARGLIFLPGFSTVGNVSQVAGRGVGMDVVASATRELGGFVDVDSEQGRYTEIRLNLPLTQAMTRGILIASGDDRYAIPYKGVVTVTRLTGAALAERYREERPQIEHEGEHYPLYYLGELLWGQPPAEKEGDIAATRPVMLFKLGDRRFALHVDHQLGAIQLFVKSLGPQLGRIPGLSGATIADDGDVILVLELFELVQQFQRRDHRRRAGEPVPGKPARVRPTVLVVDDSLTVRKVTARTLERNNYEVLLARDGIEALGLLQDSPPDLVLTDIEMPRMDGFELLGAIRNDRAAADTPVVMISSRTARKHRARAEALGVSAYLGKPYTEIDLIDTIERLLPAREAVTHEGTSTGEPGKPQAGDAHAD